MKMEGTPMQHQKNQYVHLGVMTLLSFVAMYWLMYAMVDSTADVYNNLNQVYMAGLMAAPMVLIELAVMRGMYHDKRLNIVLVIGATVAGVLCFTLIRLQTAITDSQFLRSMISHHSSAILMCQEAPLTDARIRDLCRSIISGQRAEIDAMKRLLAE
jgi:uncharacterized protein (DUF305 family)